MGHSCEGQRGRTYSKSRSVQKRPWFRTSHGHVPCYVPNSTKTSPFSVEFRSVADSVLVCSSRGHWQSNTQNQEIKNDRELTWCLWGVVLLRLVRLSYAIRQRRSSAKKIVITERRKKKVFYSTTVCFQSLRRRLASEASVMTSLRRARGVRKGGGKKWNVSAWANQRASETVVGGTLCSHVSGACSTSVMWPPRGVLNTVNGGGDRRKEFNFSTYF